MTKQLILSEDQLLSIGFERIDYPKEEPNDDTPYESLPRTVYKIPCLNGHFYFNADEKVNVWYHKTIIGDASNHVCLNIEKLPELFLVLLCFNVKFNYKSLLL